MSSSFCTLVAIVLFLVPGYVHNAVRRRVALEQNPSQADRLLQAVFAGILLYPVLLFLLWVLGQFPFFKGHVVAVVERIKDLRVPSFSDGWFLGWSFAGLLAVSAIAGCLCGHWQRKGCCKQVLTKLGVPNT